MPFRKSDARRVQALFDEAVTAPYEAEVVLSNANTVMTISVADPDNAALNVVKCSFDYNPAPAVRGPSTSRVPRRSWSSAPSSPPPVPNTNLRPETPE
jgi:hypothetical protein